MLYRTDLVKKVLALLLFTLISGCAAHRVEAPREMPVQTKRVEVRERGVVYLAIIWNQSKPLFKVRDVREASLKNFESAVIESIEDNVNPFSLAKDKRLPPITLNILPAIFRDIEMLDKVRGDDLYHMTHIKAEGLKEEEKIFILKNFFPEERMDFISTYDRYQDLYKKRGDDISRAIGRFRTEDYRDLQVWYYLLNQDDKFLQSPFPSKLLDKERFFTEREKETLFKERYKEVIKDLLFSYTQVSNLEIMVSPYGNPLMPLIYKNDIALESNPDMDLPKKVFGFPQDVRRLLFQGVALYRGVFDRAPSGVWPPEGGVSHDLVDILASTGAKWFVTGADVFDASLSKGDIEAALSDKTTHKTKPSPHLPYRVEDKGKKREIAVIFTDKKVNSEISSLLNAERGEAAADRLIKRIDSIEKKWNKPQPPLVTIILEGDIFKDNWDSKGKRVMNRFFSRIDGSSGVKMVTPETYLSLYPEIVSIESLGAGTFYGKGFDFWIGEKEENIGWTYLADTRKILEVYKNSGKANIEKVDRAFEYMFMAENSIWFWYFGQDHNTQDDREYEKRFRSLLRSVYKTIGVEPPSKLYSSFVSEEVGVGATSIKGMLSPKIDGEVGKGEWDAAGSYVSPMGEETILEKIFYGYDESNLFLRLDLKSPLVITTVEDLFLGIYVGMQGILKGNVYSRFQNPQKVEAPGFPITYELGLDIPSINWTEPRVPEARLSYACGDNKWCKLRRLNRVALNEDVIEVEVPLELLRTAGEVDVGKMFVTLSKNGEEAERIPEAGAIEINLPAHPQREEIIYALDALGDDFGPGDYVYPSNPVYIKGAFDIERFTVARDEKGVVFKVKMAELSNPLNGRNGFSLQQIDIYIDLNNRPGAGSRFLLPGRNAYVKSNDAWEFAISANGWRSVLYKLDSLGNPQKLCDIETEVNEEDNTVTIFFPGDIVRGNPDNWGYVPLVMTYDIEGDGSDWGIGEVREEPDEFHFGGGINRYLSPNIIDVVLPYGEDQKAVLGAHKTREAIEISALRRF